MTFKAEMHFAERLKNGSQVKAGLSDLTLTQPTTSFLKQLGMCTDLILVISNCPFSWDLFGFSEEKFFPLVFF